MRKNLIASEGGSVYLFSICGISILSSLFYYVMAGRVGSFAGMSIADWVGYAVTQVAIVLVVYLFSLWRKYDVLTVSKLRPCRNPVRYLLLFPIALLTIIAFLPLSMLFQAFFEAIGVNATVAAGSIDFSNPGVYFLALFVIALLPAFGEELLLRGTVLPALTTRGVWFGVFISALLFSLMHANPAQTAYQFCIGAVLAVVFLLSNSLLSCIILHFLNNFITLTITAYIPEINNVIASLGAWNWLTGAIAFVVGTILLFVLLYAFYKAGQPKKDDNGFRVVDNGIIFEEYALYAKADAPAKKKRVSGDGFVNAFRFAASMFTPKGWRAAERAIASTALDIPYLGKSQPMINVWLAIGFAAFYWIIAFLQVLL